MSASAAEKEESRFGHVARDLGLLNQDQVEEVADIRRQLRDLGVTPKAVAQVCLEKGFLTREQIDRIRREAEERAEWPDIPGYRIIRRLGRGGMGTVYQAHQESLDRTVAIKVLAPRFADDPAYIEKFISEAKTVARLNAPNIIGGIDVGESAGRHYFVMEYVDGETASRRLEAGGPLPETEVISIGVQMAQALSHAHEAGLVHRDIKPHNILITPAGVAKLCDLGLAKATGEASLRAEGGRAVGTPYYISPEQCKGPGGADIRSDIYSLGATLYHLAAGEPPFEGASAMVIMTKHMTQAPPKLRSRNPQVSIALERVIDRMMAKAKGDRYATPGALLEDLRWLEGRRPPPKKASGRSGRRKTRRRPPSARRRGPLPVILLITAAVLLIGGFVLMGQRGGGGEVEIWSPEADEALKAVVDRIQESQEKDAAAKIRLLQPIVDTYPGTRAAERAQEMIGDLQ